MWRTRFLFAACAAMIVAASPSHRTGAQGADPTTWPLLQFSNLEYKGGFRLPGQTVNGQSFTFADGFIAFNPAGPSLFVGTRAPYRIAEVTIPTPVNTSNVTAMPFASFIQNFADPTEGHLAEVSADLGGVGLNSLLVHGGRLYGTASIYYDASNSQRLSHYSRSLNLAEPSFSGWSEVWQTAKAGFVSGLMSAVPLEWQSRLGGQVVSGNCCIPIVSRTSWGPASFAFNPTDVGQPMVAATPLLYYTGEHQTLGTYSGSNPTFGATTGMGGLAIIAGTRTALFVGRNGTGPYCYGNGTSNQSLHNTPGPDGVLWCYDPAFSSKGPHAYPYNYQMWAYDLNDFAAVKAGTKQPWEVVPYGVWPFELPTPHVEVTLTGVAYDAATQRLYLSQRKADQDGYSSRPIIHVFQINAAPPNPVTNVTIAADRSAPQPPNTAITFTATATGGVSPVQYQWFAYDGCTWTTGNWTTSNQFTWTPTAHNANAQIGVWAKSAANTTDSAEANASMAFKIGGGAGAVASVSLGASHTSPQPAGTTIVWMATPSGGTGALLYKWWIDDGTTTMPVTAWMSSSSYAWRPSVPNGQYRITVWVKQASNGADSAEASASSQDFIVTGS